MSCRSEKVREIVKINLDLIFLLMLAMSVITAFVFYYAWNRPALNIPKTIEPPLTHYYIDQCIYNSNSIMVRGWAFLPENKKILNRIYAEKNNGEKVELMSSTQQRNDVSEAYRSGTLYDKSGFIATRRENSAEELFKKEIEIISIDQEGVGHAAKYTCK